MHLHGLLQREALYHQAETLSLYTRSLKVSYLGPILLIQNYFHTMFSWDITQGAYQ